MNFDNIVDMMNNAETYIDLYDACAYIVDDDLRNNIEQNIQQYEIEGKNIESVVKYIIEDWLSEKSYKLKESIEIEDNCGLDKYIEYIQESSNDKDLLNIIDAMDENKSINTDIVDGTRQIFKNNRYSKFKDKIAVLVKFINENINSADTLTESVSNKDKENDSINDKKEEELDDETLEALTDRIGQQFNVGEFNSVLQGIFGQYNQVFLLTSDLYNMDLTKTNSIDVDDEDKIYTISFDVIDNNNGIIELVDISVEEV